LSKAGHTENATTQPLFPFPPNKGRTLPKSARKRLQKQEPKFEKPKFEEPKFEEPEEF